MNILKMSMSIETRPISKTVVINSYPRSASVFFLNVLYKITDERIQGASIHLPGLIGTSRASTITIFRDPLESLSSHFFHGFGAGNNKGYEVPEGSIKSECINYLQYMDAVVSNNSRFSTFDKVTSNAVKEAEKFLKAEGIAVNKRMIDSIKDSEVLSHIDISGNRLYDGHYPRSVETNHSYLKIKAFLEQSESVIFTRNSYFDFVSSI